MASLSGPRSTASALQTPCEHDCLEVAPSTSGTSNTYLRHNPSNSSNGPDGLAVHAAGSHPARAAASAALPIQLHLSRQDAIDHERPVEEELHGRSKLFRVTSVPEHRAAMPPPQEGRDCDDMCGGSSGCRTDFEQPTASGSEQTSLPTLSALTNGLSTHAEEKEEDEETGEQNVLLPKSELASVGDRRRRLGTASPPALLLWLPQESGSGGGDGGDQERRSPDGSSDRNLLLLPQAGAVAPSSTAPSSSFGSFSAATGVAAGSGPSKPGFKERRPSITFAPPSVIPIEPIDDDGDHRDDRDDDDASGGGSVTTIQGGVAGRVHYRKQRDRQLRRGSAEPAGVLTGGFGSSDGLPRASGRGRSQSLLLPPMTYTAVDSGSGRPSPSPPRSPNSRNISTLSLTMLLRDQRRKNLALLARLFAARQREKDMIEGITDANEAIAAATTTDVNKRRKCKRFGLMEAAMVVLFCSLVSIVTASLLLLDPKRNEALHKRPGFTLDKEKALLVVFDGRGRELKVRVGVGSAGPRYSCLVEASAHDKRGTASPLQPNCVRWPAERATLDVALSAANEAITCVDVHWTWHEAPPPSSTVTDCVDLRGGGGGEAWYGGADSSTLPWMLNGGSGGRRTGRLFYAAGAPDVGPVAEKLWLSDGGHLVAEMSDGCGSGGGEARAATSLYVELADNGSSLCLSDSPSYRQRYGPGKRLTYVACVARDARSAHGWLTRRRLNASSSEATANRGHLDVSIGESLVASDGGEVAVDGEGAEKEDGEEDEGDGEGEDTRMYPDDLVKADPIWTLPERGVADYVQRVARYGFGHAALLLDENALLLSTDDLVRRLNAAADALLLESNGTASGGARLGVVVSPAVGIGSDLALRHLHEPLWFSSQPDDLPLLMHHSASGRASVLLNLTRQLARNVVVDKLTAVAGAASAPQALADNELRNASWRMALLVLADAGAASVMALEHHSEVRQESIAEFAASYRGLRRDLMLAGLALDYRVDGGPVPLTPPPSRRRGGVSPFVYLFPPSVRRRSACGLLAHLLAASVAGHAAIDVGPFGGGADGVSGNITIAERRRAYVSWLQLAALSSAVHFGLPPWLAAGDGEDDADTVRLTHQLLELRRSVVAPRLRSALRKHASDGTPVYRPLWWDGAPAANASGTRKASAIAAAAATQFFIDDVLFAPTCDGRRRRNIFIPRGYWQDASGELFVGPDIFSYSPAADCPLPFFIESPVGAA